MLTIARHLPRVGTLSAGSVLSYCRRLYDGFIQSQAIIKERESLSRLDDRLLADIGLTREQQAVECSKVLRGLTPADDQSSIQNRINSPQNW